MLSRKAQKVRKMKEFLLKALREREISLRGINEKTGVGITTINNWLFKGIEPTVTNAEKVLKALGYKITIEKEVKK